MTLIASWSVFILHTHTLTHSHYAILSIISHMIHTSIYIYMLYTHNIQCMLVYILLLYKIISYL